MPIYGSKFQNLGGSKKGEFFDISKIGTFQPGKWLIGDIFENPNQGFYKTIFHTYGQILDQISESWVPLKLLQMCEKMDILHSMRFIPITRS